MTERKESQFYSGAEDKPGLKTQFHLEIYRGLALGEAGFLRIPDFIEGMIIYNIAADFVVLSEDLDIPLPRIGLTITWGSNNPQLSGNYSVRDIIANATVNNHYPEGIVRYSPFYLKSYVSSKLGIEQDIECSPVPLSSVNGHEAYHLWQYRNQRDRVLRDVHVLENEGLDEWNQTQTEIDARKFEKRWLERVYNGYI